MPFTWNILINFLVIGSFVSLMSLYIKFIKSLLCTIPGSWIFKSDRFRLTPLQYSCLENPMDGGAWWTTVHGVAKSWTRLSDFTFTFNLLWSIRSSVMKTCSFHIAFSGITQSNSSVELSIWLRAEASCQQQALIYHLVSGSFKPQKVFSCSPSWPSTWWQTSKPEPCNLVLVA